jgi:ketosteroid isomerase-like protein
MDSPHEQIRNLLGSYCERMDAGDFKELAALFADATLADEHGSVFATGSDEVHRMWQTQTVLYDGSPRTRHVTANPVINVDGDVATCTSSYIVFQGIEDFPLQPIVSGRYADTFARDEAGRWRWTQRRYAIDHAGDLSHHLRTS